MHWLVILALSWGVILSLAGFRRVFLFVLGHFGHKDVCEIEADGIAQGQNQASDISDFLAHLQPFFVLGHFLSRPLGGDPKKMLHQFRRLCRKRHAQIFGIVKLFPLPGGNEIGHALA